MYAIVDIETTGGYAEKHKITEVAIFIHDGTQVIDTYSTLINPSHHLPGYIIGLTGITPGMLKDAPAFCDVASRIHELLHDKIFVAHNVHFDYSFLKRELEASGFPLNLKKLCTVRLTRKLIPGLKSYSLGNIASHMRVPVHARHRAGGDAKATAIIFDKFLRMDRNGVIQQLLKKTNKEMRLPSNVSEEQFEALPEEPGVYYFLDQFKQVIYVGKAKNIKQRLSGHFSGRGGSWSNQNIRNQIHDIKYVLTGNEFVALIHESLEIKKLWPKYNSAQKNERSLWGLFSFEDQLGYSRFVAGKQMPGMVPVKTFKSHSEVWHFLQAQVKEYKLCSKLCGLHKVAAACYDHATGDCHGACIQQEPADEYNRRVESFLESLVENDTTASCAILGKGRQQDERSIVLIEKGSYVGHGFIPRVANVDVIDEVKGYITPAVETPEIKQYILTELSVAPEYRIKVY